MIKYDIDFAGFREMNYIKFGINCSHWNCNQILKKKMF